MDSERKLATIRKINSIFPIEGADRIEAAKIGGWTVVVKKGEFKPDDLCVYMEIDSVLPEKPEFEFLKEKKFRIKTARLRGVISQGICFPLSIVPYPTGQTETSVGLVFSVKEGDDVTELLGVTKWEPPISLTMGGVVKGSFHTSVPKTDEERVQNLTNEINMWRDIEFVPSEKIDGTSSTYVYDGEFNVCSREIMLARPEEGQTNLYWDIAKKKNLEAGMQKFSEVFDLQFAIQGEIAGPGIQGNRIQLKEIDLFLFNAFNITEQRYFDFEELSNVAKFLNLRTVPALCDGSIVLGNKTVDALVKEADGFSVLTPDRIREGVVFRSKENHLKLSQFGKVSFKALSNEYILKYGL